MAEQSLNDAENLVGMRADRRTSPADVTVDKPETTRHLVSCLKQSRDLLRRQNARQLLRLVDMVPGLSVTTGTIDDPQFGKVLHVGVIAKFAELQTVRQVILWLRQERISLPTVVHLADGRRIEW